jgi:hypothetical protein
VRLGQGRKNKERKKQYEYVVLNVIALSPDNTVWCIVVLPVVIGLVTKMFPREFLPGPLVEATIADRRARLLHTGRVLVANSVQKNTSGTYESGWKKWMQFVKWIEIDQLLRLQPGDWVSDGVYTYREEIWISFIGWLFHDKNMNPGSVKVYLAAVRFVFLNRGVDISFLSSACVKAARSATYLLWRATHPDEKSRALPISMDMIIHAENHSLNSRSLEDRGILVALKIAFVCLLRVSEYLPMSTEHYLRGRDIVFIFRGAQVGEEILVPSYKLGDRSVTGLIGVVVNVRSSKTDALAEGHRFHFYVVDSVGTAINISVVLFEWAMLVKPEKDAPFLAGVNRSCVSYDVLNKAIKRLAYELGLNPIFFSTHSCRVGGATALGAAGVPDYLIQNLGRWKSLAFLGYVRCSVRACSIAMRALSDSSLVTVEHVRKMVPGECR